MNIDKILIGQSFDDFLMECLKPYGVTKESIKQNIDRLSIFRLSSFTSFSDISQIHLNGKYICTIVGTPYVEDNNIKMHFKKIIEDSKEG